MSPSGGAAADRAAAREPAASPDAGSVQGVAQGAPASNGVFVSFEGGDGAGKSTQLDRVAEWVAAETGRDVVRTREPGGTELGRALRSLVLHGGDVDRRAEALLYAADRAHPVATLIRPALEAGSVVLTDRYLDSSVAYQSGGRGLSPRDIERLSLWATDGLIPHLTVLLDIEPGRGLARTTGAPDRLERAGDEFHLRTREAFLQRAAAEPARWLVLDATRPMAELTAQIVGRLAPLLDAGRADRGPARSDRAASEPPSGAGGQR